MRVRFAAENLLLPIAYRGTGSGVPPSHTQRRFPCRLPGQHGLRLLARWISNNASEHYYNESIVP